MDITKQYCKGCQNNRTLDNFTEGFKTCNKCREKRKCGGKPTLKKLKKQKQKLQKNTIVLYVKEKSNGAKSLSMKREHVIRRMLEEKLTLKNLKMKMNQTVDIMIMKVAHFIVALLVNALVFGLTDGDYIEEVRFINTIQQVNYLFELSNVNTNPLVFTMNYYANYVVYLFHFLLMYCVFLHYLL